MDGNHATSSFRDRETEGAIVHGCNSDVTHLDLGQLLQSFRVYLLTLARRELTYELRGKCGASDVVQETFREAHRDWTKFRGTTSHEVRAWLRGILLNNIRDAAKGFGQIKRNARLEVPIGPPALQSLIDPELTPRAQASAQEEAVLIARAISGLPEDHRRVVELRSRENRSFQEIGEILGRSPDAARMLWFRAIDNLRRELAEYDAT